jgi:phage terminase small subunit
MHEEDEDVSGDEGEEEMMQTIESSPIAPTPLPPHLESEEIHEPIDPLGSLRPRQRRLAQLLAEGKTNTEIQTELGYSASRISILQNHPAIRAEVGRLQDKIFEVSIEQRLKDFNTIALDHVEYVLRDKTNRVKVTEKNELAKWVIEMQKSRAPQVHDIGQNLLATLMDRLDAKKTDRRITSGPAQQFDHGNQIIDVTESSSLITSSVPQTPAPSPAAPKAKEDELESWVDDFYEDKE